MATAGSEIREHEDSNKPTGSDPDRLTSEGSQITNHGDLERVINMPSQPDADDSTGDAQRFADDIGINMPPHQPNTNDANGLARKDLQGSCSQRPWFTIYIAFMAIQCAILALHFQEPSSPFKTHPAKMWVYLFAMFIHVGTALYCVKSFITGSIRSKICDQVGHISGSLASAIFLSILVPRILVPFVYLIWMVHLPIYFDTTRNWIVHVAIKLYGYGAIYVQNIQNSNGGSNNEEATNPQTS